MSQHYSNPTRAANKWSLPDVKVFQLTAAEVVEQDDDLMREYSRRHEFRLATMNSRVRERMIDAIVEEQGITGGWFYWYCFPGCLPDSDPFGPYPTRADAIAAAQEQND